MAGLPACMNHPEVPAVCIATNLNSGDVATVCNDCLRDFCMVVLESLTGLPINDILTSIVSVEPDDETPGGAPDPTLHDSESPASSDGGTPHDDAEPDDDDGLTDDERAYLARKATDESPATTQP